MTVVPFEQVDQSEAWGTFFFPSRQLFIVVTTCALQAHVPKDSPTRRVAIVHFFLSSLPACLYFLDFCIFDGLTR